MKIGILTFHNSENYGASLQCYALQRVLNRIVDDCRVINFKKDKVYSKGKKGLNKYVSLPFIARYLYHAFYKKNLRLKSERFKTFNIRYLKINSKEYIGEENISEAVADYDVIIFGSDQIWNLDPRVYDGSRVYFGDFEYIGKKIAYGASFGDNIMIAEKNRDYVIDKVRKFDSVAVRELNAVEFLRKNGISSEWVLDPTLLLNKEEWEELVDENPIIDDDYILYYSVNCRPYSWKVAQHLANITGLKVINLVEHPKIAVAGFINFYEGGPIEFLNIIKYAKYVVTNSFHGTVFAIVFERPIIPVFDLRENEVILEERKYTFLEAIGLEGLVHTCRTELDLDKIESIDFSSVKKKLDDLSVKSIDYLKITLEKCINDTV